MNGSEAGRATQPVAPAVGLLIGGLFLMVCSIISDRWLEASEPHFKVADSYVRSVGLLAGEVDLDDLGMRSFGLALMVAVIVLLMIGKFKRWALNAAQVCSLLAIGSHAWWVFSERETAAGRGFVLGVVSLALIATGTTIVLMRPRSPTGSLCEVGETIDGFKHGRWHIYDGGRCIAIEEWDKGSLVSSRPYGD